MLMMILIKPWNIVHSSFQHHNKIMKRRKCLIRNLFRRYILLYLRVCGIIEGVTLDIKSMQCTKSQQRKSHNKSNINLISCIFYLNLDCKVSTIINRFLNVGNFFMLQSLFYLILYC